MLDAKNKKKLKNYCVVISVLFSTFSFSENSFARRQPTQESINATFQLQVDKIKEGCKNENPENDSKYKNCSIVRYKSMISFYEKLFRYRDTKGIGSAEFRKGIGCLDRYSPLVNEENRKKAIELTNWIMANKCYESSLK